MNIGRINVYLVDLVDLCDLVDFSMITLMVGTTLVSPAMFTNLSLKSDDIRGHTFKLNTFELVENGYNL